MPRGGWTMPGKPWNCSLKRPGQGPLPLVKPCIPIMQTIRETDNSITEEALSIIQSDPLLQKNRKLRDVQGSLAQRRGWHCGFKIDRTLLPAHHRTHQKRETCWLAAHAAYPALTCMRPSMPAREHPAWIWGHFAAAGLSCYRKTSTLLAGNLKRWLTAASIQGY